MRKRGEEVQAEVIAVLRRSGAPLTAYGILDELKKSSNPKIAPTTVYRSLAALTDGGRVHRLEKLNAYVACQGSDHDQEPILAICDDCGTVTETLDPELLHKLGAVLKPSGFLAKRHVIEVYGVCAACGPEQAER